MTDSDAIDLTKRHLTQWAAQFSVAAELCKRGYEVAFTMGNTTPEADLMVVPPGRKRLIDVKGQSTKSFSRTRQMKNERKSLFYVLAYVPIKGANRSFLSYRKNGFVS